MVSGPMSPRLADDLPYCLFLMCAQGASAGFTRLLLRCTAAGRLLLLWLLLLVLLVEEEGDCCPCCLRCRHLQRRTRRLLLRLACSS